MGRLIFHVDVNSAFLSWEATRQVKQGLPDLRLVPSCIGGRPESRRGVVLAKSIPAKKYNIRTGEPISMALRKCPSLVIAPPDFKLYSQCSKAFKDICRAYAPVVEEFSIDECFLDFSHTEHIYPDPIALAYEIKDKIRDELGFTVNVGIGENKLCAKMASDFEKPDKVHTLFMKELSDKMWPLPVRDLLFIGGSTAKKLNDAGIRTIGELAKSDISFLQRIIGNKMSVQAHNYANGIDPSPVKAEPEEAKGYSNSVTLEDDVRDIESANSILLALSDSVTRHMRRDGAKAFNVSVTIRYLDFKTRSHQKQLSSPVETTNAVYEIAKQLLSELWKDRRPLRLMGISLTNLTKENSTGIQMSLFGEDLKIDSERDQKLDKAIDAIRGRFGSESVKRATVMKDGLNVAKKFKGEEDSSK
ncbi:DNA polymerase thumb domain-containing protein [Ruminococcus sp.]|uniref:DNA polymerase Y family protein n=1 Tax=Ruminococcus sp. TaxID=41978 RepID=UPI00386DBBE3